MGLPNTMATSPDLDYQNEILPRVSRTFALTIPQLPGELRDIVGNAYLLCRLADTIEDDPHLSSDAKRAFMEEFVAALRGERDPDEFARALGARMSDAMSDAERELVSHTASVLRVTATFREGYRRAVMRCVSIMGRGMPEFQQHKTLAGLATLPDMDRYCYYVAGVVGEMLTDLFCEYCGELAPRRQEMMKLSVCFGQGLQMTNILKDIWEDRESGTCWLPRSAFTAVPGGLSRAMEERDALALRDGIATLVGVANAHLASALRYTQMIPKSEPGMRRFCLWAIGMAVLTLRKIHHHPGYLSGREVKISRRSVAATVALCNAGHYSNRALGWMFAAATFGLPRAEPGDTTPPPGARLVSDRLG
jgi:farnesyl-diphosphate farnesyltransferase